MINTATYLLPPAGDELETIEILKIKEFSEEAFAEVFTFDGRVVWERVSPDDAERFQEKLKHYRVAIKRNPEVSFTPSAKPVIRLDSDGIVGYGSSLLYKGIGEDGRPQYWHIPTGTILTEDVSYAGNQMIDTFLRLERWKLSGGFLGLLPALTP
jgi:hypothetical protein